MFSYKTYQQPGSYYIHTDRQTDIANLIGALS